MPQEVRKRKQGSVEFTVNTKVPLTLSRGMVYRELYLKLTGQPTIAASNNTEAKTAWGDEWGVIKRIDLIANNTDVLRSLSGNAIWWLNYFMLGHAPLVDANIADAGANPAFESVIIIPLWMPRALRPMDTALDARNLSDLKLEVTWGTFTDVNIDATAWTVEPQLDVYSLESFNVKGPFSQQRVYTIEKQITATSAQFQIQLPVGPMYRGFMLNFQDDGKDSGAVLNNFKIISGTTVYADVCDAILKQSEQLRNQVIQSWDTNQEAYDNPKRGTTYNSLDGWFFYDHVTDGYLSESIDTLGFSEFELELDVTKPTGTIRCFVFPIQVIPVRGKK